MSKVLPKSTKNILQKLLLTHAFIVQYKLDGMLKELWSQSDLRVDQVVKIHTLVPYFCIICTIANFHQISNIFPLSIMYHIQNLTRIRSTVANLL